jgi:hypothetical protein
LQAIIKKITAKLKTAPAKYEKVLNVGSPMEEIISGQ